LQGTTTNNSGRDEVTCLRSVDDIHPDIVVPCSLAYSHIHVRLVGGANDQRTTDHIISAKESGPISDKALGSEVYQGLGKVWADHHDACLGLKQPLHFPRRNFPATDHQAAFPLQIHKHRIIAWHISVLMHALSPLPYTGGITMSYPSVRLHRIFRSINSLSSMPQIHVVGARRTQHGNKSR
jgi:hypothetical protein